MVLQRAHAFARGFWASFVFSTRLKPAIHLRARLTWQFPVKIIHVERHEFCRVDLAATRPRKIPSVKSADGGVRGNERIQRGAMTVAGKPAARRLRSRNISAALSWR